LITKFLSEDDEELKSIGGIYDETGMDGLDSSEEEETESSDLKDQ